ncbi:MAG TPA: hypothetical protein VJU61_07020 [Polyangiaceae bacterium]|nr:hypothetical protein [Polyangiaceae bacterium]
MSSVDKFKSDFKEETKKVVSDLQTLRDEIRLKLHLAGAEGRDAWNKLEPQLEQFEQKVEATTEAAVGELRSAGTELKANFERLVKSLRKP